MRKALIRWLGGVPREVHDRQVEINGLLWRDLDAKQNEMFGLEKEVDRLMAALEKAQRNDYRDSKGRFAKKK